MIIFKYEESMEYFVVKEPSRWSPSGWNEIVAPWKYSDSRNKILSVMIILTLLLFIYPFGSAMGGAMGNWQMVSLLACFGMAGLTFAVTGNWDRMDELWFKHWKEHKHLMENRNGKN